MQNEALVVFRILATLVFFGTLYAGYFLFRNYERLFGVDPNMPSENGSSRAYSKVQVFAIWAHVLFASGAFALMLH
jgi:heme/copper-type cytochrome/quinol oxidase subunit 3